MEWHNTDGEWEMVNDDGFIYKRRKKRVEADVFPIATREGQPEEDTKALSSASLKQQRKKQMLLAAKAKYTVELEAWEKLAAATAPDTSQESDTESSPSKFPPDQSLQSLHVEVLNMEEYIVLLQDKIRQAEATYKLLVKDIREERNFRPADEIIRALTAPASMDPDTT